jgi:hypothetical protein
MKFVLKYFFSTSDRLKSAWPSALRGLDFYSEMIYSNTWQFNCRCGSVVEQLTRNEQAVSSTLTSGSNLKAAGFGIRGFLLL